MDRLVGASALGGLSNRRVVVTGDTGFKGSWLCLVLSRLGADVVGFALPPRRDDDHFCLLKLDRLIHHVDGDIRDDAAIRSVVEAFQPECLFHLAAQANTLLSYHEPKATLDTNVAGSVNVLEAVRAVESVRALIFVTSDKCYRNREWIWGYREDDELGGSDPYSASKAAAEMVFSAYMQSYFHPRPGFGGASVRAGNVIGGGDWSTDRLVPDCIRALRNRQPITLRNPSSTRPWQHVLEPLSGYLLLAARLLDAPKALSGAWNFGPPSHDIRTVRDLSEEVVRAWGDGEIQFEEPASRGAEARLLHLCCDKAHHYLNWAPRWDFERMVAETVEWYRSVLAGTPAMDVTERQIDRYFGKFE